MAASSFTFLGTGTSVGVPMIGCDCRVCRSPDPRNNRYRCAVLVRVPHGNILIDTPPELRLQLLREGIGVVHAVLFTHYPADHLFGRRVEMLTLAVLSQLRARGNWHRVAREWMYGDPPETELGREEAAFYGE